MKASKAYSRYCALPNCNFLTEGQIRSLRTLLDNRSRNTTLTADERNSLRGVYEYETSPHYRISQEHEDKGLEFLQRCMFRKDGKPRQDKRSRVFSDLHREIVSSFEEFYFCGFYDATDYSHLSAHYFDRRNYFPVYRCCGKAGCFDYYYDRDRASFEILDECCAAKEFDRAA